MVLLILDFKNAYTGALEGIELCLQSVVPALFPFIILSTLLTTSFAGEKARMLRPIGRLCGVPEGGEPLFIVGLFGGYPVGAQCIYRAYESGQIPNDDAQRMLGFCNNAGPAFIFGIIASQYEQKYIPWIIWGIQILSAVLTGILLPCERAGRYTLKNQNDTSITATIEKSVKTMGIICGWIVIIRIVIHYLEIWLHGILPPELLIVLCGLIELTNGSVTLHNIPSVILRFIAANGLLSFGGLCVWLQTIGVTGRMNRKFFYLGKLLQAAQSLVISSALACIIFSKTTLCYKLITAVILLSVLLIGMLIVKKTVALRKKVLYNERKTSRKEHPYAFS